eukprot:g1685.t1
MENQPLLQKSRHLRQSISSFDASKAAAQSRFHFRIFLLASILLWLFAGFAGVFFFRAVKGWTWIDGLYFAVFTSTTTGYGDLTPSVTQERLFAIFYLVGVLLLLAVGVGFAMKKYESFILLEEYETLHKLHKEIIANSDAMKVGTTGKTMNESIVKRIHHVLAYDYNPHLEVYWEFYIGLIQFFCLLLVGFLLYVFLIHLNASPADRQDLIDVIINGVYFAFVSMTTIGFGDIVPTTQTGRLLVSLYLLISFPLSAFLFTAATRLPQKLKTRQDRKKWLNMIVDNNWKKKKDSVEKKHERFLLEDEIDEGKFVLFMLLLNGELDEDVFLNLRSKFSLFQSMYDVKNSKNSGSVDMSAIVDLLKNNKKL